jgi:hypothetical protein
MHWNVVSAKHLDRYRLAVTFADGTSGVVDLARHVRAGGVFARLSDVNTFKQFTINPDFGTICWGDDLDTHELHRRMGGQGGDGCLGSLHDPGGSGILAQRIGSLVRHT